MTSLRTMVVDDERIGRSRLRRLLAAEPAVELIAECADGLSAVHVIAEEKPDLLFLDISMPGLDGFGVLEVLGPERQPPVVVFVTAHDEHAVRAFESCALDYLLKPVAQPRLAKSLARAREHLAHFPPAPHGRPEIAAQRRAAPGDSLQVSGAQVAPHRFMVRSGPRLLFVAPEEIDWVEAAGNYMILHAAAANHMVRETMSGMEKLLPPANFLRVSRSAIVNLQRVKELYHAPTGEHAVILRDGAHVHISRPLREITDRLSAF